MKITDYLIIILGQLGGGVVLVFAFSHWLGKVWAGRIIENQKHELQKEFERAFRYSDSQFSRYNELWITLSDLKKAGEDLWNQATKMSLSAFAKELAKAENKVDQSFLFIEENHYQELTRLFEEFRQFQFGKSHLMDVRSQRVQNQNDFTEDEIANTIRNNGTIRDRYSSLLRRLGHEFKKQLKDGVAS